MTESELKALLATEISAALGHDSGDLSAQRAKAMDYYLGEMMEHLPAPEGRSRAISTDVQDVIESIMPSMLEIFTGTEEVAKFSAVGPEDEEAAEQETDYVNHVFYHQCDGFLVLHDFIKDALLQKNGVVKHWWEKTEQFERERYEGLDEASLALLLADKDVEPLEHASHRSERGPLHDVTLKRRCAYGRPRVEVVPPGEFLIACDAKTIKDARFVGHKTKKTQSDLIAMGFPKSKVEELPSFAAVETIEEQARRTAGVDEARHAHDEQNRAMRLIEIVECYPRLDWNGDGIAEIRKVTCSADGSVILDNEPCDRAPFSAMCAIRMPHKWLGRAVADLIVDLQTMKTVLLRQFLDDCYQQVSPRIIVPEDAAGEFTYEDLQTHRPGGIIRVQREGVVPFPTASVGAQLLPAIEYIDSVRETRTGVTRYNQGLDAQSLNKTATGLGQIMSAAQMRLRMIARVFAETGVRDLFLALHELIQKHDRQKHTVRLKNKWVPVDPAQWRNRTDMTISVALGSGGRIEQLAFLQQLLGIQVQAIQMQGGPNGPLVTLGNVYATLKRLVETGGLKSVEPYFTDPTGQQTQAQPDPRIELEKEKLEADKQLRAAELQLKDKEIGIKAYEVQARVGLDANRLEHDKVSDAEARETRKQDRESQHLAAHHEREFKARESERAREAKLMGDAVRGNLPEKIASAVQSAMRTAFAQMPKPPKMKRTPIRGADGLIIQVIDEPMEDGVPDPDGRVSTPGPAENEEKRP
jgi:hypothetical protein